MISTALMLTFATVVVAEDAAVVAPKGAFTKTAGDFEITWTFKKDKQLGFTMTNTGSKDALKITADYTITKEGKVEMTVAKAETVGDFPVSPPKGTKYGFTVAMKDKKLVLSDLTGEEVEGAKDVVEGEYEPAKDK